MTPQQWLSQQNVFERSICELLYRTTLNIMVGVNDIVYHNAIGFSLSASPFDRIAYIASQNGYVNYGFFFGKDLPDPSGIVEGSGKRIRHVKIRTTAQVRNPELEKLITAAWQNAENDILHWRQSLKRKKIEI